MSKFLLKDYLILAKKAGLRFAFDYFINAHFFDLLRGTDTHKMIEKSQEKDTQWSSQSNSGVDYMVSWTRVIKDSLKYLFDFLGNEFQTYQFIDIGCGKGKPSLVYLEFIQDKNINNTFNPIGIDYSKINIEIAKKNSTIISKNNNLRSSKVPRYIHSEAKNLYKYISTKKLILFIYNPFIDKVFHDFVEEIKSYDCIIVYSNPTQIKYLKEKQFSTIYSFSGWHPRLNTNLLSNHHF